MHWSCPVAAYTQPNTEDENHRAMAPVKGGGVCPARYFCINYPDFNPGFTLP